MKKSELKNIIRFITAEVIKEYMNVPSSLPDKEDPGDEKDVSKDLTSAEKSKIEREKRHDREVKMKEKRLELDAAKKRLDWQKKEIDKTQRYDIPSINKDMQSLQGARI